MGRSFFSGFLLGCVIAAIGLVLLSQSLPRPGLTAQLPPDQQGEALADAERSASGTGTPASSDPASPDPAAPVAGAAEVPPGSEFARGKVDGPVILPGAEATPPVTLELARPEGAGPEGLALDEMAVRSPGVPETGTAGGLSAPAPQAAPSTGAIAPGPVTPVPESLPGAPIVAPVPEGSPEIADDALAPVPGSPLATGMAVNGGAAPAGFPTNELEALDRAPEVAPQAAPPDTLPALPSDPESPPQLPGQMASARASLPAFVPAIQANAEPFDASDPRPRMAIVLIDQPDGAMAPEVLKAFPYPLSIAVETDRAGSARRAADFREAGFEVLARAELSEETQVSEIDSRGDAWFAAVPGAVALMEGEAGALQRGRTSTEALSRRLLQDGYGLLLYPEGQDVARKLAEHDGVPARTVFRDLDQNGEGPGMIGRFLDFAALQAQDEGGVVIVGRLRPETVQGLVSWGLAGQSGAVQLVPVSAVLTGGETTR